MHSSASAANAVHFVGSILILKQTGGKETPKNQQAHLAAAAVAAETATSTTTTATAVVATFAKSFWPSTAHFGYDSSFSSIRFISSIWAVA